MSIASIALPRILRIGGGASKQLGEVLETLGLSRPLIVTDPWLLNSGRVDELAGGLASAGIAARVFADTVPDPTIASINVGVAFLQEGDHDCVVGFGGGSPLDSAKAIALLGHHGGAMADYKAPHVQDTPGLPVIAIPTTAGTGSEATRFTIITDDATDEKMLCPGLAYLPVAALVDYELTFTKPRRLTADTGIDSLTHAIEAYVSRRANPFSDGMAMLAMRAIAPNLRRVCADPMDAAAREAMMLGATQAGIAFSNSSVALVHGMSRPIGAHFHVPHGLSNAMLLPAVTAWSAPAALPRYADCARAMGVADDAEGDQAAVARLIDELAALNRELEVPGPAAWGIDAARWDALIPTMCAQAAASGSPANNPRIPDADEMAMLYAKIWAG
ncbi:iron-containing alcohol dehydrogenase [Sphingopyxis alaskensis]|uniref:Alcohol dehydrogenase 2 n=1 Tax=Sphingopyxis alaskensis (strain DSM 13593 / LMG 18877 / RB2256) TaxID=317655 RepID=Q1GWE1_SPHAL|nr:iron-containing alcohol dehydrogenase [Sphingopyxis alaskensis]ABF52031.1 iron-containing alcohol dehydrogenase [Sphingopyxis alaskensis RB2256]MCM3419277.1 iron-containing alcohol dehydrogenase [Sphingopyxis alaskensis]